MGCDVHTSVWLTNPPSQPTHNTLTPFPQDQRTKLTQDEGKGREWEYNSVRDWERKTGCTKSTRQHKQIQLFHIKQFLTSKANSNCITLTAHLYASKAALCIFTPTPSASTWIIAEFYNGGAKLGSNFEAELKIWSILVSHLIEQKMCRGIC